MRSKGTHLQPIENKAKKRPATGLKRLFVVGIASVGGVGFFPFAPGTAGSLVTLPLFWLLAFHSPYLYGLCVLVVIVAGILAADGFELLFGRKDDGRIVIDEVAGQLLTLAPLPYLLRVTCSKAGSVGESWSWAAPQAAVLEVGWLGGLGWVVTGFVAFRVFDIWKPGPVRWAERNFAGGTGVMMDDLVAGVMGAVVLVALVFSVGALG